MLYAMNYAKPDTSLLVKSKPNANLLAKSNAELNANLPHAMNMQNQIQIC